MHPRSPNRSGPGVLAGVLGVLVVAASIQAATEPAAGDDEAELDPVGLLVPDAQLDPRILFLELTGSSWQGAVSRLEQALFDLQQATRGREAVSATVVELGGKLDRLRGDLERTLVDETELAEQLARLDRALAHHAVERFVRHGSGSDPTDVVAGLDAARTLLIAEEGEQAQLVRRAELRDRLDGLEMRLATLEAQVFETSTSLASARLRLDQLRLEVSAADAEAADAADRLRSTRRGATVRGTDLSVVALDAYLRAETRLGDDLPSCGVSWWMVAGVARVESRHGTLGGRALRADGRVDDPIIGVALDGGPRVRVVDDTDDGRLDGDPDHDRAVGPFQFIPETWDRLGRDGNDDGIVDPQNIYDAAYSAGRYLCRLGGDLASSSALRSAYYGYNTSSDYADTVLRHARRYADLNLPDPPPPEPRSGPAATRGAQGG